MLPDGFSHVALIGAETGTRRVVDRMGFQQAGKETPSQQSHTFDSKCTNSPHEADRLVNAVVNTYQDESAKKTEQLSGRGNNSEAK